ncbi:MAG: flagellar biosynthetic protein FliO [Betaproteobacteria bacterium]|nr:flagellar biosynthetic protein FliO [Betaproteobacteria bacterium]
MYPRLLIAASALFPLTAYASAGETAGSVFSMLFGLAIVLAALFCVLHLIKRLQTRSGANQANLKLVGAIAVGPRERVVLLEVGERVLILGVTPSSINTLARMPAADVPRNTAPSDPTPDFAARLSNVLKGKRNAN